MTSRFLLAASLIGGASALACHNVGRSAPAVTAEMRTSSGASLGTLELASTSGGVRITGRLSGGITGVHGMHFHSVGRCDAPDFTSAGGHVNPTAKQHGLANPAGPHLGDLPSVEATTDGTITVDLTSPRVTLDDAAVTGLLDADGAALVLHAGADDQRTDPSGGSGARVACGVIRRS